MLLHAVSFLSFSTVPCQRRWCRENSLTLPWPSYNPAIYLDIVICLHILRSEGTIMILYPNPLGHSQDYEILPSSSCRGENYSLLLHKWTLVSPTACYSYCKASSTYHNLSDEINNNAANQNERQTKEILIEIQQIWASSLPKFPCAPLHTEILGTNASRSLLFLCIH